MAKKKPAKVKKAAAVKKAVKAKPAPKKTARPSGGKKAKPVKAAKPSPKKAAKPAKPAVKKSAKAVPAKKAGNKPARPAVKAAPVKSKTAAAKPSRPAPRPVIKGKPAPAGKPVPAKTPAKGAALSPSKGAALSPSKGAALSPSKGAPEKPAPAKGKPVLKEAPAPVKNSAPAPKPEKAAPPPPPANLPKLPKDIVLKKQKGKLAPGEKRIVKTEVITHHVVDDMPLEELDKKAKPEPKGKFTLEYIIHTPITLLYDFLTTPNGLAEWFADGVDMKNDIYTFDWDGQKQNARILGAKIDNYIRLRWLDKPEGSYFEFRLNQDELTNEVSLIVTDFGESEDDIATSRRLWDSQIQRLVKALGTY